MVIFKLFKDIVEIGWVRGIYDGSGNFQDFSGFLWPKLRVPYCKVFVEKTVIEDTKEGFQLKFDADPLFLV